MIHSHRYKIKPNQKLLQRPTYLSTVVPLLYNCEEHSNFLFLGMKPLLLQSNTPQNYVNVYLWSIFIPHFTCVVSTVHMLLPSNWTGCKDSMLLFYIPQKICHNKSIFLDYHFRIINYIKQCHFQHISSCVPNDIINDL